VRTVLVAYATKHGSTREVADAIAETLRAHGDSADVRPAAEVASLEGYDGIVLGGSIYMGRWHSDARAFLERHATALAARPFGVFGMGPRTSEQADIADSRQQLDRWLAKAPVTPASVAVFGGVLDPSKLSFPFNRMPASDARDWDAIASWAGEIADMLPTRGHMPFASFEAAVT
jgi:menaquinone-dependent protoporphyrinogen oxidase